MEYDQLELQRETIFKDAVVKGAEERARRIIERAETDSQRQIQTALATCEEADHDAIAAAHKQETARQLGAMGHEARRELLELRAALVDEMFRDIREELEAFTQSEAYLPWLVAKLKTAREAFHSNAIITVHLRYADMDKAEALGKTQPGSRYAPVDDIQLGGMRIACEKRMLDCTLDAALMAERERFAATSGLQVETE